MSAVVAQALREALDGIDNPTGAARALARVTTRLRPDYRGEVDALRWAAEQELAPFFDGDRQAAKAVTWAVVDAALRNGRPAEPTGDDHDQDRDPDDSARARSLTEILADPKSLKPPEPVADRFAYRGRVVLLAAREKDGKSTLASAVASSVSAGRPWLGGHTIAGTVLYVGLEEHPSDTVRRLLDFGADPDRMFLLERLTEPIRELEAEVATVEPTMIVIDTLAALTETLALDPGSSSAWTPVMGKLTRLARDSDAALLLLHHARKSDGKYRDSTAIGAGVDAVLEMSEDGTDRAVRHVQARARWAMSDFSVRLVGDPDDSAVGLRYELAAGELSLEVRVHRFVEAHPGTSTRAVLDGVRGRSRDVSAALGRLEANGAIENRGGESAHAWHHRPFPGPETPSGATVSRENPQGNATETVSGNAERATVSGFPSLGNAPRETVDDLEEDLALALEGDR